MNNARVRKLQAMACILSLAILSACGQISPATPTLAPTATPTASPTSTVTPLPTKTSTAQPSSTPEIKQFGICDADSWRACRIPLQELGANGAYLRWLEQTWKPNLPTPDPEKHFVNLDSRGVLLYLRSDRRGAPGAADRPYATGFTYGYAECGVTWGGVSHQMICPVVPIAMSVPGRPGEIRIILGLSEQGYNQPDSDVAAIFKALQGDEVLMLAGYAQDQVSGRTTLGKGDTIDIMQQTIADYPDIMDRINQFQSTLDPSWLSGPGLLLRVFAVQIRS